MRSTLCGREQSCRCPIRAIHHFWTLSLILLILLSLVAAGCSDASKGTGNSSAVSNQKPGANSNANAEPATGAARTETIDIKEPERYGVQMTMSVQETTTETPAPMLTQQLSLARFDADRRWAFSMPAPLGQVVYLEKSGLRYLVFFDRKQYIELTTNALGFQPLEVLTPNAIAPMLKARRHEKLGLEPVNGRTATKYRLPANSDGSTHADVIFVDQETGLALRSELNSAALSGKRVRMIVEVRDLQLNPDRAQFEVPAGMKKITQQEAKQQVEGFANVLRSFANIIRGIDSTPVPNAASPAANSNANRGAR